MRSKIVDVPELREKRYVFRDRVDAGRFLARKLEEELERDEIQILAIPAGGVPVGYTVAQELNLNFEIVVVRKIKIPWNPEAGFGAVSWNGIALLNDRLVAELKLSRDLIDKSVSQTKENIRKRIEIFRGVRPFPDLEKKEVILVDDGIASGYTMTVAVRSIDRYKPEEVMVAVPTASSSSLRRVAEEADRVICLNIRSTPIFAVADAYRNWRDISDREVIEYLNLFDKKD